MREPVGGEMKFFPMRRDDDVRTSQDFQVEQGVSVEVERDLFDMCSDDDCDWQEARDSLSHLSEFSSELQRSSTPKAKTVPRQNWNYVSD